jgi:hypothetical protein
MFNKNLKELTVEVLKKREQQFGFGYVIAMMLSIGSCQKSPPFAFLFIVVALFFIGQSGEVKKELKSRE